MNDYIKKGVAAVIAAVGGYMVAWGIVSAEVWAPMGSPEVVGAMTAVAAYAFYNVMNRITSWSWSAFSKPEDGAAA